NHRFAARTHVPLSELSNERWALGEPGLPTQQRFQEVFRDNELGAAARCIGVSLALAEIAGSGKRRSASVHLEGGNHTIRNGGNRAQGSPGRGASLGAICRSTPPRGALCLSGRPPVH